MLGTSHSSMATREGLVFQSFPYVFEIAHFDHTRWHSSAVGNIRTLSMMDRFCISFLVAEAFDFQWCCHVVGNFGNNTEPRDHAAVRFFIQKPTSRRHQSKHISSWFHLAATSWRPQILSWPILYTCWIQSSPTQSREDYDTWVVKANTWLHRRKFLITSTALRAYRNRHLWTLMLCWEAPKPIGDFVASFTH